MDVSRAAQNILRCGLCENPSIESYCLYCHEILCKSCVERHNSGAYEKHAIIPYKERRSILFDKKCASHPNKTCELQCKDCNFIVCIYCIVSEKHRGHIFENIIDSYGIRNKTLEKDTQESEALQTQSKKEEVLGELRKEMSWSGHITSGLLSKQFNSFKIECPDDHLRHSFAHVILNEELRKDLMCEIKSLSNGIVLTTNFRRKTQIKQPGEFSVIEVEVISAEDQLGVVQKVNINIYIKTL